MPSKTGRQAKNGINIYSNASISVYAVSMIKHSSDGYLALPLRFLLLGYEYMVMTYTPVMNAFVMVTAKHDQTEVTFHLKLSGLWGVTVNGTSYKDGERFKVMLNAFDSFQILADSSAGSLSGTRVISNKVLFVYSGNDCAYVPLNGSSCDHLVEQMPPISTWGNAFLVKSTPYRGNGDFFHIMASQNQTVITIELESGPVSVTINEGEVHEFNCPSDSSYAIRTTKPSLVVQFGTSHRSVNTKFAPFMSIVPANDQWSNDYTLVVPSDNSRVFQCYANLFVDSREASQIETKSITPVNKIEWKRIPSTLFSSSTVNLTSGQYRFYHKSPLKSFSVMFLCTADYEAFGFPAGLRIFRRASRCTNPKMIPGDRRDNDCDDKADEELLNGIDDDGDGRIDEDLATPIPVLNADAVVNQTECYVPSVSKLSSLITPNYQVFGMCSVRGNTKILYNDFTLPYQNCFVRKNRTWILTDGCLNRIQQNQIVNTYMKYPLRVNFPSALKRHVWDCDDPKLGHNYKSNEPTIQSSCAGNVTISHSDSGWENLRRCSYTDFVVVKRTWIVSNGCSRQSGEQLISIKKMG